MRIKLLALALLLASPFAHGSGTGYSDVLGHVTVNGPYGPEAIDKQESGLYPDMPITVIIHVADEEAAQELATTLNSIAKKDKDL